MEVVIATSDESTDPWGSSKDNQKSEMKLERWAVVTALIGSQSVTANYLPADDATNTINSLKQRIEELDWKVRILEGDSNQEKQSVDLEVRTAPKMTFGERGFSLGSADGNFAINLRGVLQLDSRTFFKDGGIKGNDGFLLRRARPIIEGTVFQDFDFVFVPDFGGSTVQIFDAYLNYRYNPALQVQLGKFKSPIGLEQLQADTNLPFNERSLATDLVPNRDLGVELHGELFDGAVSYGAGVFNGIGDARNSNNADFENDKDFAGRLFLQPLKRSESPALRGLGLGIGGGFGDSSTVNALPATTGGTTPGYVTDWQQQFFAYRNTAAANGRRWRISPQGSYFYGPCGLLGEYAVSSQHVQTNALNTAPLRTTAWQITASWVLTGEDASFKGVSPARAFDPSIGHWGA